MSAASIPPITGDRLPRKARRLAAELPELGRIRHVEGNPPSPLAWWVTIGCAVVFTAIIALGNGSLADALVLIPAWAVIAWIILGYLGAEKVVVLDRGLLIGSFAPFLRPYVVPFDRFEVGSITAVRPGWKLPRMLSGRTKLTTGRTAVWAWNGVAFVAAPGPLARRSTVDAAGIFGPEDPARRERLVWWFGTWRQPDRLVNALESALVDLGHPVAGLSQQVLPLVPISGHPADAARQVPRLVATLESSR
ncbi:hypothetical protein FB561_3161 [Kribbella amoyensis]|uniref:Uncharacterized protein n=1 Tax=Kribbella amoyensis TaxID=996641 RepID=A0A561BT28_9ACTN|nr:hypothetical protein [Kribbella amoyensis]TWD82035.1 hypothetical protein FB561_3161 [Kribbella amoyensis]